ncbi:unnamed protein product [Cylicocyclus nassatus]|uniref:DUF4781 domain-containing protein n=1 Tax=Cylicocyclus nassatus TaxID=53992 RepID=A0AA36M058_CYLNA|nr:unnamed protein product [Cylicocyclus nassatus]
MGNTLAGETLGTWDDEDVLKWKKDARMQQQTFYLQFEGTQFHDISDLSVALRVTKIAFAIIGLPTTEKEKLEDAYSDEQRAFAKTVYDKIHEVYMEAPIKQFRLGFIFICCKEGEKQYQVPLFRLVWNCEGGVNDVRYIDTSCRVYKSAQDWKDNNRLPMLKYCYPKRLFYTCSDSYDYDFDVDKDVVLEYGTSPACDLTARLGRIGDVVISTTAMTVGLVSMFTPAGFVSAPLLLTVGVSSGVYGAGRAIDRLIDKGSHGESLGDLESILLFVAIAASPLNLLSGFVNARLAAGAAAGRIFSQTERILATLLIMTTFGIDSFSMVLNIASLVKKKMEGNLTSLDVLQFSVSLLFFANTVVQPKTATGVIAKAQEARIGAISETMTDQQAKEVFKAYLKENKGDGGIKATSKVVRNLNRMEDPNAFFKGAAGFKSIQIGGRKGKTVLLTSEHGQVHRANPNDRATYSAETFSQVPKVQKIARLRQCLGGDYECHEQLGRLNPQQKARLNKVFGGAAKYDKRIVDYATKLAEQMNVRNDPDAFMSLVEVVAAEARGNRNFDFNNTADFQRNVNSDLARIHKLAASKRLRFADDFKALYHFRKHGAEFMEMCELKFYLGKLPNDIRANGNLTDVCDIKVVAPDGAVDMFTRKTYYKPDDSMLVVIEKNGMEKISTIYKDAGGWKQFESRFNVTNISTPEIALGKFAALAGLSSWQMKLHSMEHGKVWDSLDACSVGDRDLIAKLVSILVHEQVEFLDSSEDEGFYDE